MSIKKNITSIFFMPTLKIPNDWRDKHNFINGYIEDLGKEIPYEDSIYLLFKPEDIDNFREFLNEEYERTRNIIDDYDYEGGFVVVVYKLNPKFKKDFELIKLGKYSKTSIEFQEQFPKSKKIWTGNSYRDEVSIHYRIFNRAQDLIKFWENRIGIEFTKEMEVWDGFFPENEILDINKIKKEYE